MELLENLLNDIIQPTCELKNNAKSLHFRQLGNGQFVKKTVQSFLSALSLYNEAICCAEPNSEDLGFAYANRSAVYIELKLHKECLKSIEWAFAQSGFPERLRTKLDLRRAAAIAAIGQQPEDIGPIEPKLCKPSNPKIPIIVNCLELKQNAQYGRHVVTNEDLKVGDIIAIDTPFCTALGEGLQYERCDNCCMEAARNLLPCNVCIGVMYCGEKCRDEAFHRYHKFECPIIDFLHRKLPLASMRTAFRATLCALSELGTLDALDAFAADADQSDHHLFAMDFSAGKVSAKERYGPIYAMQMANENPATQHVVHDVMRLVCLQMMTHGTVDGFNEMDEDRCERLLRFMHRHYHASVLSRCVLADVGVTIEMIRVGATRFTRDETMGMYPFRSLLNHACVPNIASSTYGNQLVVTVIKPIKAGEQIFDCYQYLHAAYPLEVRRKNLTFRCECIACQKDYPLITKMRGARVRPSAELWKDCFAELHKCDRKKSCANQKEAAKYLQDHDHEYPTKELAFVSGYYRHIIELMYCKEIPLSARFASLGGAADARLELLSAFGVM